MWCNHLANFSLQITQAKVKILPCWCLHLVVVGELEYPNKPESYAAGSVATGRVTLGGQVEE
jgi:hypothetical protein